MKNNYMSTYKFYREKIYLSEKKGKSTEELWKKLDVPFLSFAKYPNILADFGPQTRTAGKKP